MSMELRSNHVSLPNNGVGAGIAAALCAMVLAIAFSTCAFTQSAFAGEQGAASTGAIALQSADGKVTTAATEAPPVLTLKSSSDAMGLQAQQVLSSDGYSITAGHLKVSGLESGKALYGAAGGYCWLYVSIDDYYAQGNVSITCSNPNLANINPASITSETGYSRGGSVEIQGKACGIGTVTVRYGTDVISFPLVAYPDVTQVTSVKKASYSGVKVTWKKTPGVSGYFVKQAPASEYGWATGDPTVVATVKGENTTSATVKGVPWDKRYVYSVTPYMEHGGKQYLVDSTNYSDPFLLPAATLKLKSVKKSGSKNFKLTWAADAGASSFTVYRSTSENHGYKKIATTKAKSYIDKKAKKGTIYYYRVVAAYPGYGKVTSNSVGQSLATKVKILKALVSGIKMDYGYGSYYWATASPDTVYFYKQGSRVYAVCYYQNKLYIYGFNSKFKKVYSKKVSLPKHDMWGGFYHGPDGNNYVTVGYSNTKESKSKTVIKVIKYGKTWKKGKTAAIKGGASNAFEGIFTPFTASGTSFDMNGNTLYLFTGRTMFQTDDGLRHQSNIAFSIDTKTMKAKEDNIAYTSHSFNQRVRFKDGTIFLADHGDAFDRGINLVMEPYHRDAAESARIRVLPFVFKGQPGNNSTGATMGGMEVGMKNVLVCGTAQPHNFKVAGVSGFKGSLKENVYVTVTDRATGKSSVKWLTSINPKKGKQTVGETRMVKISDSRFGVLYSVRDDKTGNQKVHYTVVDGNGKKVKSKTYKGMQFSGSSQPIYVNGGICWMEKNSDDYSDKKATFYRIPA